MQLRVLDLHNCRLKRTNFKDSYDNRMYGFLLMAKGKKHEFYNYSQAEIKDWIQAMKPFTICLNLKEDFRVGPLIGKGKSAKVNRCEHTNERNKFYAMKTIKKDFINQNR